MKTNSILKAKRVAVLELRTAYKQASDRFELGAELVKQQARLDEVLHALVWAHLDAKEEVHFTLWADKWAYLTAYIFH